MKTLLRLISYAGLAISIVPAVLLFSGSLQRPAYYACMTTGMILWFVTSYFWIEPPKAGE